jgi:hypothetical protein
MHAVCGCSLTDAADLSAPSPQAMKLATDMFVRWNASLQTGQPATVAKEYKTDGVLLPTVSNNVSQWGMHAVLPAGGEHSERAAPGTVAKLCDDTASQTQASNIAALIQSGPSALQHAWLNDTHMIPT